MLSLLDIWLSLGSFDYMQRHTDDILLLAPSVTALQQLLSVCESELKDLDMLVNARKSACMRVGPRSNVPCDNIVTVSGH